MMSLLFYFTESVKRDNDELSFSFLSAKARILVFCLTEQTEKNSQVSSPIPKKTMKTYSTFIKQNEIVSLPITVMERK
jgi:hypothetical protein